MTITQEAKRKKTFPLEIEEDLHKALKFRAIETDMTLHAYIIEALNARVREDSAAYFGKSDGQTAGVGDKP
jgi:predicted HicB family RNase H-like nuclease